MKKQFTHRSIRCCTAFLVLGVLGACAAPPAPAPAQPYAAQHTVNVEIASTSAPISDLEGQIIKPLIQDTNNNGTFEPALAQELEHHQYR